MTENEQVMFWRVAALCDDVAKFCGDVELDEDDICSLNHIECQCENILGRADDAK